MRSTAFPATGLPFASRSVTVICDASTAPAVTDPGDVSTDEDEALTVKGCCASMASRSAARPSTPGGTGSARYAKKALSNVTRNTDSPCGLSSITTGLLPQAATQSPSGRRRLLPQQLEVVTSGSTTCSTNVADRADGSMAYRTA